MPVKKTAAKSRPHPIKRRRFDDAFKQEAIQMLLDGHTASSVAERLGISNANLLYRWKREQLQQSGPVASTLDQQVQTLTAELRRVERERDILKKALSIFSRLE